MIKLLISILPILIGILVITHMNTETLLRESSIICILNSDCSKMLFLERNPKYETNTDEKHELELPGGKIDGEETYEQCIIRELKEETTLCLNIDKSTKILTKTPEQRGRMIFIHTLDDDHMSTIEQAKHNMKNELIVNESKCAGITLHWININVLKHSVNTKNLTISLDENFSLPLRKFNMFVLQEIFKLL